MKKVLSLILAALMLLSVVTLVSCGDTGDTEKTTVAPADSSKGDDEPVDTSYTVEQKDYSAREKFVVYMRDRNSSSYAPKYIVYDETTDSGDVVDQAVFNRNTRLEEFYKIKLEFMETTNPTTQLPNDIKSDIEYDVIYDQRNLIGSTMLSGACKSWTNLNVDYSKDWWDSNALKALSIAGKCYHMTNDVSMVRFSGTRFLYFNKEIVTNYRLSNPYELIDKNEWTLDNFLNMVKSVRCETIGIDDLGVYGLVNEGGTNAVYIHMTAGFDIQITNTNSAGELEFVIGEKTSLEKIDTAYAKIKEVFTDETCVLSQARAKELDVKGTSASAKDKYVGGRMLFAAGHFLFTHASLGSSSLYTEMKDYGVAPNPKYNSDQDGYYHKVDKTTLMFCLPNVKFDAGDAEFIGDVMNYWAYVSQSTVLPAYYDITIKSKRVQDAKAVEIIDLIRTSIRYEIADLLGAFNMTNVFKGAYEGSGISSSWTTYQSGYEKGLRAINEKVKTLN